MRDTSYTGVSTQYVIDLAEGATATVVRAEHGTCRVGDAAPSRRHGAPHVVAGRHVRRRPSPVPADRGCGRRRRSRSIHDQRIEEDPMAEPDGSRAPGARRPALTTADAAARGRDRRRRVPRRVRDGRGPGGSPTPGGSAGPTPGGSVAPTPGGSSPTSGSFRWANWIGYMPIERGRRHLPGPRAVHGGDGHRRRVQRGDRGQRGLLRVRPAGPAAASQPTGWDIVVLTDWMIQRLIALGWLEPIDTGG